MRTASRWAMVVLVGLAVGILASCGDDDENTTTTTASATECAESEGPGNVIESYRVAFSGRSGTLMFRLTREADVGVLVTTSGLEARLVGRVPFGPQRKVVDVTTDMKADFLEEIEPGEYKFTLRAFENGKLNVGEPIDTSTRCVEVR